MEIRDLHLERRPASNQIHKTFESYVNQYIPSKHKNLRV